MKLLAIFILLLCQLTTVNGQQTGCRIPVTLLSLDLGLSSTQTAQSPQPIAQGGKDTVVSSPLSVDFYINQINLADSLYKNYLPQYNYDEVKAAVEFFDSVQSSAVSRQRGGLFNKKATDGNKLIAESRLLTAAKAHYYHAVGLTERDDIVGACEHYLKALEIMDELGMRNEELGMKGKKSQGSQPIAQGTEEYEKTRFIALIYTRLGDLFYNECCTSIAKDAFKNCINLYVSINDSLSFAYCYMRLGDIYIMENIHDTSLYFYKKSIESLGYANNQITRDSWKGISAVLHHKGDIDTSYMIVNDLISTTTGDEQYTYKTLLAQMYYKDEVYDSALIYFKEVLKRDNKYTQISSANYISKIYSLKGDVEQSIYYQNLYSDELIEEFNRTSHKSQLMDCYNDYMYKKLVPSEADDNNSLLILLIIIPLCLFSYMVYFYHIRNKNVDNILEKCIKTYKDCINDFKNENIYSKISLVKNVYIKSAETNNYKEFQFSNEDKEIFIDSINKCFNDYATKLVKSFPDLNFVDVLYCCLVLLGLENKEIGALMGVQYQSVKDRLRKLSSIFNTDKLNYFINNKCEEFLNS